jgi:hypothetical protein
VDEHLDRLPDLSVVAHEEMPTGFDGLELRARYACCCLRRSLKRAAPRSKVEIEDQRVPAATDPGGPEGAWILISAQLWKWVQDHQLADVEPGP